MELLERRLRDEGLDVRTRWYRPGYSPELDALRRVVRSLRAEALPPPGPSEKRNQVFQSRRVQLGWTTVAFMDAVLQYVLKLRAELLLGRVVIFDRYVFDAALDLELKSPALRLNAFDLHAWLSAVAPTPALALLLTLPEDEVRRRVEEKNEPFPDPPEVRAKRYGRYEEWKANDAFTVIDASGSIEEVHAEIWRHVLRTIPSVSPAQRATVEA